MKLGEVRWLLMKPGLEVRAVIKLNDDNEVKISVPKDSIRKAVAGMSHKVETDWSLDPENPDILIVD